MAASQSRSLASLALTHQQPRVLARFETRRATHLKIIVAHSDLTRGSVHVFRTAICSFLATSRAWFLSATVTQYINFLDLIVRTWPRFSSPQPTLERTRKPICDLAATFERSIRRHSGT